MSQEDLQSRPWSRSDTLLSIFLFLTGIIARAPLVARIEGVLDHDQSVVGLMALDIANGRRLPIFFDGQRYMGALEAYIAAGFVRLFGHEPNIIALAPLLCFGAFTACQYIVWRVWRDRATGLLAAGLTVLGAPMLVLWGIVPRGGYIELMAWVLPAMAVYRWVSRRGVHDLSPVKQVGWGFLLGLGYLLNPLSLTVYVTLALDWIFIRHGNELRGERLGKAQWLDKGWASLVWITIATAWLLAIAFCCHVDFFKGEAELPYVAFGGLVGKAWALPAGAIGVVLLLVAAGWWSNAPRRLYARLIQCPWSLLGLVFALFPFLLNGVLTRLGRIPAAPSLPVWIAAPWRAGPNLRTIARALGPLLGCDPHVTETVLIGQGVDPPPVRLQGLSNSLMMLSPVVVTVVLLLVVLLAYQNRATLNRVIMLRGDDVAPPSALMFLYIGVALGMFLLQGTSPNGSSVRYLIPIWIALPGVLASALTILPRKVAVVAALGLFIPWTASQVSLWQDLDHECPERPLAIALKIRGVEGIVATTPVALIVANLSHGDVGAIEFRSIWSRLGDRYTSRFPEGRTLTCVVDRRFPWAIRGEGAWPIEHDLGRHLRALSVMNPGKVMRSWEIGPFEVWDVDLPLDLLLSKEIDRENVVARP